MCVKWDFIYNLIDIELFIMVITDWNDTLRFYIVLLKEKIFRCNSTKYF